MAKRSVPRVRPMGPCMAGAALCLVLGGIGGLVLAHDEGMPQASPPSQEEVQKVGTSSTHDAGLQAASWALTLPYGAAKIAYAIGGGIVGGLAWAMTGGKTEVAKSVWIPSMTGDYIVQPQHLTRERPLRFLGVTSEGPAF